MDKNQKKKIVYLSMALLRGGAVIVTLRIARWLLDEKGLEPIFYCTHVGYDESLLREFGFDPESTTIYVAPDPSTIASGERNVAHLSEMLTKERPLAFVDTLNNSPFDVYDSVRGLGIPIIKWWHTMPFYISKLHMSKWELRGRESFAHKLWYLFGASWQCKGFDKNEGALYAQYLRSTDLFFVLCEGYKHDIAKALNLSAQEVDKLQPMINTIEPYPSVNLENKERKIINIGRLDWVTKRYDRFVEVWKYAYERLPDWSFDIYGRDSDGSDVARLEALIRESGAPRIRFCGISHQPTEVYDTASVFLFTSAYEGWPVSLMEAQRQAVVPIASNCCKGVEEIITGKDGNKEAGILLPEPFDARRFADRLVELCQNDALRERLQQNCLEKIADYQPEVNEASWRAFFDLIGID